MINPLTPTVVMIWV